VLLMTPSVADYRDSSPADGKRKLICDSPARRRGRKMRKSGGVHSLTEDGEEQ
jgi:hypothetical protein